MIKLIFPCNYVGITQNYKTSHKAIDLGWSNNYGGPNHEIISPADGKIVYVKNNYNKTDKTGSSYGNYIKINHGGGVETLVAHLKYNSVRVKVGDTVKQGDVIAIMGNTGHSTGTHCHYEVRINNDRLNPLLYTYAKKNQIVSTNTRSKYKIKELDEEEIIVNDVNNEIEKSDNVIFEYMCTKTGVYKIQLNENEKLVIID